MPVMPSVLVISKSARGLTESVSVSVAGVGSVVPVGGAAVKVFATLPPTAVTLVVTVKLMLPPLGRVGTMTLPASRLVMFNCPAAAPAVGQIAPPEAVQVPKAVLLN